MPAAERIRQEAAQWFAKTLDGRLTGSEQAARDAWLAADPTHRAEYSALERVWQAAAAVPADRLRALVAAPDGQRDPTPARRGSKSYRWIAGASLCLLAASIGIVRLGWHADENVDIAQTRSPALTTAHAADEYTTGPGERRTLTLADGTTVEMSTRTHLRVRYTPEQRDVTLVSGEAMFSVAHNPARPFVVDAGAGRVTVTGTRFDVRRATTGVSVAVESGSVKVDGNAGGNAATVSRSSVTLTRALGTTVRADGSVSPAQPVDLTTALAWREGKLIFRNATLADVVEEVSRYRRAPVTVSDSAAARLRLTSVFSADDTDALLAALPEFLPVRLQTLPNGSVTISSK